MQTLVFRSLKRTHDMFLSEQGKLPAADEKRFVEYASLYCDCFILKIPVTTLLHYGCEVVNYLSTILIQCKILHNCEITSKTGAGDGAVQQARTL